MKRNECGGVETGAKIFDALREPARRRILVALNRRTQNGDEGVQYDVFQAFDDERTRTRLVHVDIPKLEDYGFVDWNRDSHTIQPGEDWDDIDRVLELLLEGRDRLPIDMFDTSPSDSPADSRYLLGVVCTASLSASYVAELPLGQLPVL